MLFPVLQSVSLWMYRLLHGNASRPPERIGPQGLTGFRRRGNLQGTVVGPGFDSLEVHSVPA